MFNDEEDYNYEIETTQNLQATTSKLMNSMENFPNLNSQKEKENNTILQIHILTN